MSRGLRSGGPSRHFLWFLVAMLMPVPWVVAETSGGLGIPVEGVAILAGVAILGASFLLSWSCELAERYMSQSLAILVLALVGVLPEYAVDLHFAWTAGKDISYAPYAIANMTGANRLLIGIGWSAVVFVSCWRAKSSHLEVDPRQRLEIRFLIWATLYSVLIPLDGRIDLYDGFVLIVIFICYVVAAIRNDVETEENLGGPAALIDAEFDDRGRKLWAGLFFVFAGFAIFVSAEPFAESLVELGRNYDIDNFLLVQWVAPLASESPEFIVALLFAWKMRGSIGLGALVSSKVNQWTLLVGAIPVAFALSSGGFEGLPVNERQAQEMWLTSAQSMLAALLIADLSFHRREATVLLILFLGQFVLPGSEARWAFTGFYALAFVALLILGPAEARKGFFGLLFSLPSSDRSSR